MKKLWSIISIMCALVACNRPNEAIKKQIADSDSLAINYFKGDGKIDTVVAVRIIRDKQKINQLTTFISRRSVEGDHTCGYDGSLHFFKMNKVIQDIDFRMMEGDCMYFTFLLDNKLQATSLSAEAKELISDLRK